MAGKGDNAATIIIRRVTDGAAHGHHGGAWKVAYADFVTAMMAFFLLLWLLGATTETQRKGLADYFSPSVQRTPGASGDGTQEGMRFASPEDARHESASEFDEIARQVQDALTGSGAESMQLTNLLKHVVTHMTDEGLVIELSDLSDRPLFPDDSTQPHPALMALAPIVANALRHTRNQIAIAGHVRAYPETLVNSPVWDLSEGRAHAVRRLLEDAGLDAQRVQRVSGFADRRNRSSNPMDPANNRIEVILLR
ncbi:MAG: flagellar motor protein MotB [Paracoccus sp. (in: a-proteobacteria)]|nr:flagellar motor protein MotB [Paracoccus sp. (in: a-proteobacteria)]